jgi:hypothetical protein
VSLINYVKTNWVNKLTPLSPTNMNKIEKGIEDVTIEVIAHSADYMKHGLTGTTDVTGTSTAYTLTPNPALSAYNTYLKLTVIFDKANTGASTINISGKGAIALKKQDGTNYSSGELLANTPYTFVYNGTSFLADSSSGLTEDYGNGSDGAFNSVASYPIYASPGGGVVDNLHDNNTATKCTTGTLAIGATLFSIDLGAPTSITGMIIQQISSAAANGYFTWQAANNSDFSDAITIIGTGCTSSPSDRSYTMAASDPNYSKKFRYHRLRVDSVSTSFSCGEFKTIESGPTTIIDANLNSDVTIKKYTDITINPGHIVTTSNPNGGLIMYATGNVVINGTLDMTAKGGLGIRSLPLIAVGSTVAKMKSINAAIDALRGGTGGNGGQCGGYSGASGRITGGVGGAGRQFIGGYGGGGAGGGVQTGSKLGQYGGHIPLPELGGGKGLPNAAGSQVGLSGQASAYGAGGAGGTYSGSSLKGGDCYGAGGGGAGGACSSDSGQGLDGDYAGGFILIIAKGNITIGASGSITSHGGKGGNGGQGGGASGNGAGGGGGAGGAGGGCIALLYKGTFSNGGSILANGGAAGIGGPAGYTTAEVGFTGTAGSAGSTLMQQIT